MTTTLPRRLFLALGAAFAAALGGAGLLLSRRENRARFKALVSEMAPEPSLDRAAATGALEDREAGALLALAEVLLPPGSSAAALALVRAHVSEQARRQPGRLAAYRDAIAFLDEGAGGDFAALPAAERTRLLDSVLWTYDGSSYLRRQLERATISSPALALRRLVIADIVAAFYRSEHGWAVVGYPHHPGVPAADPRDYTRPPAT